MATERQKLAVEKMVENGGIASRAMRDVGYSEQTAKSPNKLTESKGFKEICEQYGLTESLIITSLVEDINLKPQNRKPELELGAKIRGMLIDRAESTVVLTSEEKREKADQVIKDFLNKDEQNTADTIGERPANEESAIPIQPTE